MLKTYIFRPEPIQAIQWTGDNIDEIREYIKKPCSTDFNLKYGHELVIDVSTGRYDYWLRVRPGGYVSKNPSGDVYTWSREEFEGHYKEFA